MFETWDSRSGPFAVGPFTVTPILTDHSAFDAYMLLVEGAGKRLHRRLSSPWSQICAC
jgi:ribonuclease J